MIWKQITCDPLHKHIPAQSSSQAKHRPAIKTAQSSSQEKHRPAIKTAQSSSQAKHRPAIKTAQSSSQAKLKIVKSQQAIPTQLQQQHGQCPVSWLPQSTWTWQHEQSRVHHVSMNSPVFTMSAWTAQCSPCQHEQSSVHHVSMNSPMFTMSAWTAQCSPCRHEQSRVQHGSMNSPMFTMLAWTAPWSPCQHDVHHANMYRLHSLHYSPWTVTQYHDCRCMDANA